VKRAHLAMILLPDDAPDRRTSLADLRIALCLELGVDMADIDPARGTNVSRAAYEKARHSWRRHASEEPNFPERMYREARANWLARRPDWDDDWLAPEAPVPDLVPLFDLTTQPALSRPTSGENR